MFLLGYLLVDLYFFPSPLLKTHYDPNSKLKSKVPPPPSHQIAMEGNQPVSSEDVHPSCSPPLLDAVNKNSLVLFLIVCRDFILSARLRIPEFIVSISI